MSPKKNIKSNAESAVKESEENTVVEDSGVNKPVEATEQTEDPKEMLEIALKKADKNYDSFLRVSAEFDNYKKRTAREMNDFRKSFISRAVRFL